MTRVSGLHNGHAMKAQKIATKPQMYFQQKRKCRINKNATCNSKSATSSVSVTDRIKTLSKNIKAQIDIQRAECSRAGQARRAYSLHGVTQLHWLLLHSVEDLKPTSQRQNHSRSQCSDQRCNLHTSCSDRQPEW